MSNHIDLLRDLCLAPGPTGFEAPVQEVVRRRLEALRDSTDGFELAELDLELRQEGKQLGLACMLYTGDSNDRLPYNLGTAEIKAAALLFWTY